MSEWMNQWHRKRAQEWETISDIKKGTDSRKTKDYRLALKMTKCL